MKCRGLVLSMAVLAAALWTSACGSDSPTASSSGGVAVQGVVVGDSATASVADVRAVQSSQPHKVTVKVAGTTMTVDVNANGTFQINGVPSGTFTLVFLVDGVEVGRVEITAADGSDVKLVVQVNTTQVVVIQLTVDDGSTSGGGTPSSASCGVNGGTVGQGVELEGNVSSGSFPSFKMAVNGRSDFPIDVSASSASVQCIGGAKTSSDAECKAQIKSGAKVHVSGTLMTCTASSAQVTASQVKVQKD
jgi:hypothetical protein